jgi:hypothetical protein
MQQLNRSRIRNLELTGIVGTRITGALRGRLKSTRLLTGAFQSEI